MNRVRLVLALVVSFLLITGNSCQYDTDDIYFDSSVEPADPPVLTITDITELEDSLFLHKPVRINFAFDARGNEIYAVIFNVDGYEYKVFESGKDQLLLDPSDFIDGYHKLSISVITSSESRSLADKLGYEGFIFEGVEWTFYSIRRVYVPKSGVRAYTDQGGLYLAWDSCDYQKAEYIVEKYLGKEKGTLISSERIYECHYSDMMYAGEEATYEVYTTTRNSAAKILWSTYNIDKDIPVPLMESIDHKPLLYWESRPYFRNIENFSITDVLSGKRVANVSPSDTSVVIDDLYFGGSRELIFTVVPGNEPAYYESNPEEFSIASSYDFYERLPGISGTGVFCVVDGSILLFQEDAYNIKAMDLETNTVVDSLFSSPDLSSSDNNYTLAISSSRKRFCIFSKSSNSIYYGTTSDLLHHEEYKLPFESIDTKTYISDNSDEIILSNSEQFFFFDMGNKVVLDSVAFEESKIYGSVEYPSFSSDGNYFKYLWHGDLCVFAFDGRSFHKLYEQWLVSKDFGRVGFDQGKPSDLYHTDGTNLYFRRAEDFSMTSSYPYLQNGYRKILSFDFIHRRLLNRESNGDLQVVDLDNGTELFSIQAAQNQSYYIYENTILTRTGLRMDFNSK